MSLSRPDDSGLYVCLAENRLGSVNQTFSVVVQTRIVAQKPILRAGHPGNHTVLAGEDLELHCPVEIVDEATPPSITWSVVVTNWSWRYYNLLSIPSFRLYHYKVNGSEFRPDGLLNLEVLQSCATNGHCDQGVGNKSYFVDDPFVSTDEFVTVHIEWDTGAHPTSFLHHLILAECLIEGILLKRYLDSWIFTGVPPSHDSYIVCGLSPTAGGCEDIPKYKVHFMMLLVRSSSSSSSLFSRMLRVKKVTACSVSAPSRKGNVPPKVLGRHHIRL